LQKSEHKATKKALRPEKDSSPRVEEKYKGYEILLDAKPDPSLHEPMGKLSHIYKLSGLHTFFTNLMTHFF